MLTGAVNGLEVGLQPEVLGRGRVECLVAPEHDDVGRADLHAQQQGMSSTT